MLSFFKLCNPSVPAGVVQSEASGAAFDLLQQEAKVPSSDEYPHGQCYREHYSRASSGARGGVSPSL